VAYMSSVVDPLTRIEVSQYKAVARALGLEDTVPGLRRPTRAQLEYDMDDGADTPLVTRRPDVDGGR
jgi:hypothetical protein